MKWLISLGVFVAALLLSGTAAAQDASTVSGTVTDQATGQPLPGVNISVQGTTTGTTTDAEGTYELRVPSLQDTLRFTFIGYEVTTVPIQGRTTIDVQMQPTTISGEELVVVGYGTQRAKDLTGSVSVVDVGQMTQVPETQVAEQLQGQASGVTVLSSGQPGEEPSVRIRGFSTFGNNEPLYVVDGVPTQNINDLNSNDIESMQVLKDAAAASIYGSRASNGVIVITTKKGSGDVQINYNAYYGYQVPQSGNVWNTLNPREMAQSVWTAQRNAGQDPSHPQYGSGEDPVLPDFIDPPGAMEEDVDISNYFINPHYTDPSALGNFVYYTRANKEGTDWFDELFDPAGQMNHDLSVSGGSDLGNYLFSFNYLDQQGTLMEQYLKRYTVRANTEFNVSDNIRIGENLSYSVTDNPQFGTLDEGGPIGMSYRQQPIIPVYDVRGNFAGTHAEGLGNPFNPVAIAYRTRNNEYTNNRLFGNMYAEVDLWEDQLTLRTSFGGEYFSGSGHSFNYPTYENSENTTTNQYNASSYYGFNYTWTNTLTYQQDFNDLHNVKVVLATEAYKNKGQSLGGSTQDFFSFDPDFTNLSTGSGTKTNYSSRYEDALFSLIGRVDYNFDDRYMLSGTLRRDGSSRFLNNQWGLFPAGSIGWRLTEEEFFPESDIFTDLKLRAGYGIMGNQLNVDPNNPYTLFAPSNVGTYYDITGSNSSTQLGFSQSRIGNPDAKWEKNINMNIGLDATLFDGRLELNADYYKKDVEDLLYNPPLPATAGSAAQPYVNVGNMTNTGLDASMSLFGNITDDLEYNTTVTFTTYNNEIKKISRDVTYFEQAFNRFGASGIVRNAVGHPVSSYYGYKVVGFWDDEEEIANGPTQDDAAVGRFRYQDTDGDGEITPEDRTFLGNPNPDFTYGVNFGLNFKAFDFSMFWYGSQGNDLWNQVKWWTDFYPNFAGAKSKTMLYDSWTPDNPNASAPILEAASTFSTNEVQNSYYVEDGSYLRLKNVQLGYTIPKDILAPSGISSLRVYVQAANLITVTNYSGPDPEVGYNAGGGADAGGAPTAFGIDEGAYPTARQFRVGISLSY
ncbi:TonB-linked outer membrane protein, SusC/RagA family [Fodinibius sediminis]|uniref:TonB-linked outer membrane protein, SusC/RagA family n=2 Tax=Fodinibius sediminis TaxID=1214077 RepID=A0A521C699_9BACT|nr:TonB-linked outer membrane protein, SusC/RagA family [Fodinibius sediminis]